MTIAYNWKKALINAAQIFGGVLAVRLAPYSLQLTNGVLPVELLAWAFWRHAIVSGAVISGFAEFRYLYRWLMSLNGRGGNDAQGGSGPGVGSTLGIGLPKA
jgi:hypothetical protein